jgi:hypothetical protein
MNEIPRTENQEPKEATNLETKKRRRKSKPKKRKQKASSSTIYFSSFCI